MKDEPSLTLVVEVERHRQAAADHIALGLITGGLVGPSVVIEERVSNRLRFRRVGGADWLVPDVGEFRLEAGPGGGTTVECSLWCRGMRRRRLAAAVAAGAVAGAVAALGFGCLMVVSLPAAAAVAVGYDLLSARRADRALRSRIEAFLANARYLTV